MEYTEKHIEQAGKHMEHAEKHIEQAGEPMGHAEKHVEYAGTGKRPRKLQHNVNSANTSSLVAENKAKNASLLFWPVPFC